MRVDYDSFMSIIFLVLLFCGELFAQQINPQNTPPHPPRTPSIADVKYGPYPMNGLDLYLAKSNRPTPLVLYYFPGAFVVGNKNTISPNLLDACAKAGITVASIDYRYSNQAPFPGALPGCCQGAPVSPFARQRVQHRSQRRCVDRVIRWCGYFALAGLP